MQRRKTVSFSDVKCVLRNTVTKQYMKVIEEHDALYAFCLSSLSLLFGDLL